AVLKDKPSAFPKSIINEAKSLLPKKYTTQYKIDFVHDDIRFYGYADVVGDSRVIDIKTTRSYSSNKFHDNFQHLYLYGLRNFGYKQIEYHVYDFQRIHIEKYHMESIRFDKMIQQMEEFRKFLLENKPLITDPKIMVEKTGFLF
ncbi:MAG: hypothetical protein ACRCVT_14630, partial [Leadbetterella sp.]